MEFVYVTVVGLVVAKNEEVRLGKWPITDVQIDRQYNWNAYCLKTTRSNNTNRGSCWFTLPRPYNGITLSLLIPALHTGHMGLFGRVSSH